MCLNLPPLDLKVLVGCGNWVGRKGQGRNSASGHPPNCHHKQRIYLILSHSLRSCAVPALPYVSCCHQGVISRCDKKQEGEGTGPSELCLGPLYFLPSVHSTLLFLCLLFVLSPGTSPLRCSGLRCCMFSWL